MFTPIQIILVCVWMWGFTVIGMSVQLFSYGVAVLHGFVTGLIMGDVATGLTVGGTLCLMGLGVGGYGGSSVPDYAMGTVVGTVFAIATGGGVEAGLATGILGAIAAYMALEGSIVGWVIAEAIQLVIWFAFYKLFFVAYEQGVTFVTTRSAQLQHITEAASVLGLSVVGALVASTVNVKFGITMSYGEVVQPVNDLLDSIIPHFGNVVTVALIYWGLGRKSMTSGKMIIIVLVAAIVLSAIGILA